MSHSSSNFSTHAHIIFKLDLFINNRFTYTFGPLACFNLTVFINTYNCNTLHLNHKILLLYFHFSRNLFTVYKTKAREKMKGQKFLVVKHFEGEPKEDCFQLMEEELPDELNENGLLAIKFLFQLE